MQISMLGIIFCALFLTACGGSSGSGGSGGPTPIPPQEMEQLKQNIKTRWNALLDNCFCGRDQKLMLLGAVAHREAVKMGLNSESLKDSINRDNLRRLFNELKREVR